MSSEHLQYQIVVRRSDGVDTIAPDGSEIRLLIDGRHGATRASLCEVTLPAGEVSRAVWHRSVEEVWYVLEGRGQVWRWPVGEEPDDAHLSNVGPGDALAILPGWRFQFSSSETEALMFLCYTSPPWPGPQEAQPA